MGKRFIRKSVARMKRKGTIGSLTLIAARGGGLKKDGTISRSWARKKMASPRTSGAVKKKINWFLNVTKGK